MRRAVLSIKPMYPDGTEGESINELTFPFFDDTDIEQEIGKFITKTVHTFESKFEPGEDDWPDAYDLTLSFLYDRPDPVLTVDKPKPYVIEENTTHLVMAHSPEEAEAIWLDKGDEAATLLGVNERTVYEQ